MQNAPHIKRAALAMLVVLATLAAVAKKQFNMPPARDAQQYPAHDEHAKENVTVAVDPYDTSEKNETVFAGDYVQHGLTPMLLVITNNSDQPISLAAMKVEMVTRTRVKVPPATEDDVF